MIGAPGTGRGPGAAAPRSQNYPTEPTPLPAGYRVIPGNVAPRRGARRRGAPITGAGPRAAPFLTSLSGLARAALAGQWNTRPPRDLRARFRRIPVDMRPARGRLEKLRRPVPARARAIVLRGVLQGTCAGTHEKGDAVRKVMSRVGGRRECGCAFAPWVIAVLCVVTPMAAGQNCSLPIPPMWLSVWPGPPFPHWL